MIPSVLAREVRASLVDYLRTTFAFSDAAFESALFAHLEGPEGLFRGPYVDIRLPFRKAAPEDKSPLDLEVPFLPYAHQRQAFLRLSSKEQQPRPTLVTTGTGSGKTECFLYPILDHCLRHAGTSGIKAIILYPMNALASDQARRMAAELQRPALHGRVSAGLYVGGEGQHAASGPDHLIDQRATLRQSPPDILLTNYKMLDFLLLRPEDRGLWEGNAPDTLRYLVLDELHTYDGAQGSDVACLIRRLKARLETPPGGLACVGTSATIGGRQKGDGESKLIEFASKVFGQQFYEDAVVREDRYSAREALGEAIDLDRAPEPGEAADLDPDRFDGPEAYLRRQMALWLGEAELSPVELGARLRRHTVLRTLLSLLDGLPREHDALVRGLTRLEPAFEALPAEARPLALDSLVALVAHARTATGARVEPFLTTQVQLWSRELRRLVQRVPQAAAEAPAFSFNETLDRRDDSQRWLPIAHCAECGGHGLASFVRAGESTLHDAVDAIGQHWLREARECRYLIPFPPRDLLPDELFDVHLDPRSLALSRGASEGRIPVLEAPVEVKARFDGACPECGTERALGMLGSRAASLLSVAITQVFESTFNEDKKLLAFTDSVQDASHRAAFFGARTYRFNLRTAIQGAVESSDRPLTLEALGGRIVEHVRDLGLRDPELIATLTPPDLHALDEYEDFRERKGVGSNQIILKPLKERLSWEVTSEYGYQALRGRTLERTGCSVAHPDPERLDAAARALTADLVERQLLSPKVDRAEALTEPKVRHLLAGLCHRLRTRGGIFHKLLDAYVREEAKTYLLSKRMNPLLAPMPVRQRPPRFASSRADPKRVFDLLFTTPGSSAWFRDFTSRCLQVLPQDDDINEVLRLAALRLSDQALVDDRPCGKGRAYGLRPDGLLVFAGPGRVRCDRCARTVSAPAPELPRYEGQACLRARCPGLLRREAAPPRSYYERIYRSGRLNRIFTAEHTGLLERQARETLEARFKATTDREPDAPNLLVATPTLEMGIDIGDLSSVTLCAVPPATANYLQRVGRAGRKTGNALTFTVANAQPTDLYFFAQPTEMLAGEVLPPGAYLDAPYMLHRQLVAYAMDQWAKAATDVHDLPGKVSFVLGKGGERFPGKLIAYFDARRDEIVDGFLKLFPELEPETREKVAGFAADDGVGKAIRGAFERVARERDDLRNLRRRLQKRLGEIEADPGSVANPAEEKEEIGQTIKIIARLLAEILNKYPLNTLTDEGVLPNYSFPEPGVQLRSVFRKRTGELDKKGRSKFRYETLEYQRPASSAIRELAPFNHFYADGRKVTIDEVDIGNQAKPLVEQWRLCPSCHHHEGPLKAGEPPPAPTCPECDAPGWADQGQVRTLVQLRRVRSLSDRLASVTVDDTDDRERITYDGHDLIDVRKEHYRGAQVIESLPFGVEFLRDLTLREINFGFEGATGQRFDVAGTKVQEAGFEVCTDCGRVREQHKDAIDHTPYCKFKKGTIEAKTTPVFLYRAIDSEALRVLLPVSTVEVETSRASFKAALDLGFRKWFRGRPAHLLIRSVTEPTGPDRSDRRVYLVIYDAVPGGTGYLAGLWRHEEGKPASGLIGVLERAFEHMRACRCAREENRDGCHRCILAYQTARDLPRVSRQRAMELIQAILEHRDEMKEAMTLSDVSLDDRLESELEVKLRDALRDHAHGTQGLSWENALHNGGQAYKLRFEGGPTWQIEPQVDLGPSQDVDVPCRPDFLIRPLAGAPAGTRAVALFCDGLAYHAMPGRPEGRIADDLRKRASILASGRYAIWSLTWKDVEAFAAGKVAKPTAPDLFESIDATMARKAFKLADVSLPDRLHKMNPVECLLEYLRAPSWVEWSKASSALLATAAVLGARRRVAPTSINSLEARLREEDAHFTVGPQALYSGDGLPPVLSHCAEAGWATLLARVEAVHVQQKKNDEARVLLRIFDEADARSASDFEPSWRAALTAWDRIPFHDRHEVLSSEGIQAEAAAPQPMAAEGDGADTASLSADGLAVPYRPSHRPQNPALTEFLEIPGTPAEYRDLAVRLHEAGAPLPEPGWEVVGARGRTVGEAELAWIDRKLAVVTEDEREAGQALERQGYRVFWPPVDERALREALGT